MKIRLLNEEDFPNETNMNSKRDFLKPLISVCKLTMNRNGKSEIEKDYNSDFQFWFIVNYSIVQRAEFYSYDGLKMSSRPI